MVEPLTGVAVLPFDVFAEALPTKDFFAIAMMNLLFDFKLNLFIKEGAEALVRNQRGASAQFAV